MGENRDAFVGIAPITSAGNRREHNARIGGVNAEATNRAARESLGGKKRPSVSAITRFQQSQARLRKSRTRGFACACINDPRIARHEGQRPDSQCQCRRAVGDGVEGDARIAALPNAAIAHAHQPVRRVARIDGNGRYAARNKVRRAGGLGRIVAQRRGPNQRPYRHRAGSPYRDGELLGDIVASAVGESDSKRKASWRLWADIDLLGPNHAATNLPPSLEDAWKIIQAVPLKPTLVVYSGGGSQPYWLFREPIETVTDKDRRSIMLITTAITSRRRIERTRPGRDAEAGCTESCLVLCSGGLASIQQSMDLVHGVFDLHVEIPLAKRR